MHFSISTTLLMTLLLPITFILGVNGQWKITELLTHEMLDFQDVRFNSSVNFTIQRAGKDFTLCSTNWSQSPTPLIPKQWIKCNDPMLRFRVAVFNDASNYTLEVVELDPIASNGKTTSIGVTRANIAASRDLDIYCWGTNTEAGTKCGLSNPPLNLNSTSATFTPSPLPIVWSESRSDGPSSGVIPCTEAWTFYIYNLDVANLGSMTLGRNPRQWETHCDTTWACGGSDKSVNTWTNCAAPAFQFIKTLPAGGDVLSNFVMSIKHTFPLIMATSIRGTNASDIHLTDPEEAPGLQVVLTLEDTIWKDGKTMTPIMSGGIDQTGNCSIGCEFSGKNVNVKVVDMEIL